MISYFPCTYCRKRHILLFGNEHWLFYFHISSEIGDWYIRYFSVVLVSVNSNDTNADTWLENQKKIIRKNCTTYQFIYLRVWRDLKKNRIFDFIFRLFLVFKPSISIGKNKNPISMYVFIWWFCVLFCVNHTKIMLKCSFGRVWAIFPI